MELEMKPVEEMSFKEASDELDAILAKLETPSLELEESLKYYERGVALLRSLQEKLSGAQQKVNVLMGKLEETLDDDAIDSTLS
jgi:exodeoxyribonuclease VII small subunit